MWITIEIPEDIMRYLKSIGVVRLSSMWDNLMKWTLYSALKTGRTSEGTVKKIIRSIERHNEKNKSIIEKLKSLIS